jgi:hypothetical protein
MKELMYTGKNTSFTLDVDYYSERVTIGQGKTAWFPDSVADKLVKENGRIFVVTKSRMENVPKSIDPATIDDADIIDEIDDSDIDEDIEDEGSEVEYEKPFEDMNSLELKDLAKKIRLPKYTTMNTEELRSALIEHFAAIEDDEDGIADDN